MALTVVNTTGSKIPRIPFKAIKDAVLGKRYRLTLVIVTAIAIKKLNLTYRGKNKPTDVLSFILSEKSGEIYISPMEARKEARKFDRTYENFLAYLFIHGCAHLKGHDHSDTMEKYEKRLRERFMI